MSLFKNKALLKLNSPPCLSLKEWLFLTVSTAGSGGSGYAATTSSSVHPSIPMPGNRVAERNSDKRGRTQTADPISETVCD